MTARALLFSIVLAACAPARAEPPSVTLRFASVVPEGTAWARELHAFAREVESSTHGQVHLKWYLGGIAGEEPALEGRVRRDQLDAVASTGGLCQTLAPSLRVMRVPGLFQSHEEATYVANRLRPVLDRELRQAGWANLAETAIGPTILFTRAPLGSLFELRQARLWLWDTDEPSRRLLSELGLKLVASPLGEAGRAYDERKHDGFLSPPTAALAFQWTGQARYFTDLRLSFVVGCVLMSNRVFDGLPTEVQQVLRTAAVKLEARFDDAGRTMDEALLNGLLQKQGLERVPVSQAFRADFLEAARLQRERGSTVVPEGLLRRVLGLLADFRAEHH